MNFKRCTAVLLCAAMLTSGGIFSTAVSAAGVENGISATQSVSSVIIDETGSIIKVIGDKDYFTSGVLDSKGYLKSYTNEMLTNIRFKTSFNSKYGKLSSKSVMLYDSRGGKVTLKKDSEGYYTADTTRTCKWYKIVVQYKTTEGKIYKRTIKIDNSKILIDGLKTDSEGVYGTYDEKSVYRFGNNYVIPSGSVTDINNSDSAKLLKQYEITTYSDFVKNGTNASWKSFYEQSDNGVYTWKTGEYALRQVKTGSDGKKLEIIWHHKLRVVPVTKEVDMKEIYKSGSVYELEEEDLDFYDWDLSYYLDTEQVYKNALTYNNIFDIRGFLDIQAYEYDGEIKYNNDSELLDETLILNHGNYYRYARAVEAVDLPTIGYNFLGDNSHFSVYYSFGEVNADDKITWKKFKPVSSEYGENMTLGEYLYSCYESKLNKYQDLADKYEVKAGEFDVKNIDIIDKYIRLTDAQKKYGASYSYFEGASYSYFKEVLPSVYNDSKAKGYLDKIYNKYLAIKKAHKDKGENVKYDELVKETKAAMHNTVDTFNKYANSRSTYYNGLYEKYEELAENTKPVCSIKIKYNDINDNMRSFTLKNLVIS